MAILDFLGPLEENITTLGQLLVLGLIIKVIYDIGKNVFVFFFAEKLGKTVDFKAMGKWAVVTGATDGIGKGYAFDLARRGCNVVLVSRSDDKLKNVAKEIESKYPNIQTRVIAADFTKDESIYPSIKDQLEGLEIGILINNVGMSNSYPEYFVDYPDGDKYTADMIRCNCLSQTMMTRIVLPQMVSRRRGVVVSLSSGCGRTPVPLLSLYSATKAYNDFLGRALQQEYQNKGIIFQVIQPYYVATNMSGIRKSNLFVAEAGAFARSCLNTVGFFTRTNGHPSHALQNWLMTLFPYAIMGRMMLSVTLKKRDAALRKLKKKASQKEE